MKKTSDNVDTSRRDILRMAVAAAPAAVATVALSASATEASIPADTKKDAGFRETDRVRTYYSTARF